MKKDIQLIENVQRRATKQLPKISKLPYSERQLDLPTLRYRRIRGDMIEVFKILKYYDSDPNQILRHTSSATRGHSLKLAKKQSNSNLRLYSFSIRVINNWNNLSNHVVSSSNTNTFKNRLDSYWKYHPARYDWEASDYFHPGLANFDNKL